MSVKNDFIMPIIVLPLICLIVSGALAVCNSLTQPVIARAAAERAEAARRDIIPQADGFELLETGGPHNGHNGRSLPRTVTEVYKTTNGTGYVFMITTTGYGGDIKLICGIDGDGKIIRTATLAQTETKGLATPVFEEAHAGRYRGRDRNGIEDITAVSGATISSNAYKNGIRDAFTAFELVRVWQ